jgi:hypothetical protein
MVNKRHLLGLVVMALSLGLVLVGCPDPNNLEAGTDNDKLLGQWKRQGADNVKFEFKKNGMVGIDGGGDTAFSYEGITLIIRRMGKNLTGTGVLDGDTLTISGFASQGWSEFDGTFIKVGGSDGEKITFAGIASTTPYILTITGETIFELLVDGKKSTGTIESNNGGTYTLKPFGGASFTITVSSSGITAVSGTITFDDESTQAAPSEISGGGGSLAGTYQLNSDATVTAVFNSNNTWSITKTGSGGGTSSGTYTYSGTVLTITTTIGGSGTGSGVAVISGNTLVIVGDDLQGPHLTGTWTKQ